MRWLRALAGGALLLSSAGCVIPSYVVPQQLETQVNRQVSFAQLKQDAARYQGASVALGGAVLSAKLLPEGTQVEVLQLPLDAYDRPSGSLEASDGRFLLIDPQRRDPATLLDRRITVVGEVLGTRVEKVDESDYPYPYLSARFINVWRSPGDYPAGAAYPYAYPSYYRYAPAYYPYLYVDPYYWSVPFYYYGYYGGYYGGSYGHPSHSHGYSERRFSPPSGGGGYAPSTPSYTSPSSGSGGGGGGGRKFK